MAGVAGEGGGEECVRVAGVGRGRIRIPWQQALHPTRETGVAAVELSIYPIWLKSSSSDQGLHTRRLKL